MSLLAGLPLRLFAFGVLVASAAALQFDFADVQQCDQVTVSFSGSNLAPGLVPASLQILPINSTAFNISLVEPSLVYSGVALTPLPFPAGTDFLTSLDDGTGDSIISVSDVIRVLPSPIGNSSCLPNATQVTRRFSLPFNVSQCEEFSIQYDTTLVSQPPNVRLYHPTGSSFPLNMVSSTVGEATYIMGFSREKDVLLLVTDENGNMETSPLFTVGGDANSDSSCLHKNNGEKTDDRTADMHHHHNGTPGPSNSRALIIGVASGGSAVVLIAIGVVIFVVRERRKRRRNQRYNFDSSKIQMPPSNDSLNEKHTSEKSPSITSPKAVSNPIYTSDAFVSPTRSTYQRGSLASTAQIVPGDRTRQTVPTSMPPSQIIVEPPAERGSLDSLDIEGMLNMATYSLRTLPAGKIRKPRSTI
ncbi:hypothetical protein CPB84DRAFT_1824076 [Gymnopilus junonius]|uniref:Uncharacterized protein n=1 Tax=Gymnopilus junonius TaxID=109634 RepID=A0A9P5NS68_GYMJU|nr:hypothetical protein CPB84DRAFT_1824076 [Gymnopilus junonius]